MGGTSGLTSPPYPHALIHKRLMNPEMGPPSLDCPASQEHCLLAGFLSHLESYNKTCKLTLLLSVNSFF